MNIEFQDDYMLLSYFGYASNGASLFYFIQGTFDIANQSIVAPIYAFSAGQCLGCPYVVPQITQIGVGAVQFQDMDRARVQFRIGQSVTFVDVIRFGFNVGSNSAEHNLGAWQTGIVASNGFFSDFILLSVIRSTQQGIVTVGITHPYQRNVVGFVPVQGEYAVLVDASATTDYYYAFNYAVNRWNGFFWAVPKGGTPTGPGLVFHAVRIAGMKTLVQITQADSPAQVDERSVDMLRAASYDASKSAPEEKYLQRYRYLLEAREQLR